MPAKSTSTTVLYSRGIPTHDTAFSYWASLNYSIVKKMTRADPHYLSASAAAVVRCTSSPAPSLAAPFRPTMQFYS